MVTQYNTKNPDINKWLFKNWNILQTSRDTAAIFKDKPMVAFKRRPTLHNTFRSSTVQYSYLKTQSIIANPNFCKKFRAKCSHCQQISREDHSVCTVTNHKYDKLPRPSKGYLTHKKYLLLYIA